MHSTVRMTSLSGIGFLMGDDKNGTLIICVKGQAQRSHALLGTPATSSSSNDEVEANSMLGSGCLPTRAGIQAQDVSWQR